MNIFHNEKYCGDVVMQKTYTPDCLTHKVEKNRGQMRQYKMRDHHPAIVSRADWEKAQGIIDSGGIRKRKIGTAAKPAKVTIIKKGVL